MLNINEYQKFTGTTAVYDDKHSLLYLGLGLTNESGEVAGKLKKLIRDDNNNLTIERREQIAQELGDVCWYISELATLLGYNLSDILQKNMKKLTSRRNNNTIHGDGDNR